jgi:spermidine synthase
MFFSGYCGIVSELALFTLAESLIGGTLNNLLATMGVMVFCMGLGALIAGHRSFSQFHDGKFLGLELLISIFTCISIPAITFLAGRFPGWTTTSFVTVSAIIGTLIGIEIPLMQKIMQRDTAEDIQVISSRVMMADYFGSLGGFVFFPHLLKSIALPWTTLCTGGLNFTIALLICFRPQCPPWSKWVCLGMTPLFFIYGNWLNPIMDIGEQGLYRHKIVWKEQSPYQKIVVVDQQQESPELYSQRKLKHFRSQFKSLGHDPTGKIELAQKDQDISLFINGGLQFNSRDEAIYHEHLIHPMMSLLPEKRHILVMGAGDGLALRELLKYPEVEQIDVVELDPAMTHFASTHPSMIRLNKGAFQDPRVNVILEDAWTWARHQNGHYDAIVLDFPDPHHIETAKLYSLQFYKLLRYNLKDHGVLVTQATSPLYDPNVFACIRRTLEEADFVVNSLHVEMRSFGQWGFHIALPPENSKSGMDLGKHFEVWTPPSFVRSFNRESLLGAFSWPPHFDELIRAQPVNDFLTLPLFQLYEHHR